jgi:hypothetical protein
MFAVSIIRVDIMSGFKSPIYVSQMSYPVGH